MASNRRKFFRRSKPFQGVYYANPGERVPLVGLDLSGGGLCMLLQQPVKDPPPPDVTIGAVIADKALTMIGKIRWNDTIKLKGADHYRYGVKLKTIADDDWDRIMHWTVESNPDFVEGATLSAAQRDMLITPDTQGAVARELLARERIDPFQEGKLPLLEYSFVKYTMRLGIPYVWLRIRSRCSDRIQHTIADHMTNVLVSCNDGYVKVLD